MLAGHASVFHPAESPDSSSSQSLLQSLFGVKLPPSEDAVRSSAAAAAAKRGSCCCLHARVGKAKMAEWREKQMSAFKVALADLTIGKIVPIGKEMERLQKDPVYVDEILTSGAGRAKSIASGTMDQVYRSIGFR